MYKELGLNGLSGSAYLKAIAQQNVQPMPVHNIISQVAAKGSAVWDFQAPIVKIVFLVFAILMIRIFFTLILWPAFQIFAVLEVLAALHVLEARLIVILPINVL